MSTFSWDAALWLFSSSANKTNHYLPHDILTDNNLNSKRKKSSRKMIYGFHTYNSLYHVIHLPGLFLLPSQSVLHVPNHTTNNTNYCGKTKMHLNKQWKLMENVSNWKETNGAICFKGRKSNGMYNAKIKSFKDYVTNVLI